MHLLRRGISEPVLMQDGQGGGHRRRRQAARRAGAPLAHSVDRLLTPARRRRARHTKRRAQPREAHRRPMGVQQRGHEGAVLASRVG